MYGMFCIVISFTLGWHWKHTRRTELRLRPWRTKNKIFMLNVLSTQLSPFVVTSVFRVQFFCRTWTMKINYHFQNVPPPPVSLLCTNRTVKSFTKRQFEKDPCTILVLLWCSLAIDCHHMSLEISSAENSETCSLLSIELQCNAACLLFYIKCVSWMTEPFSFAKPLFMSNFCSLEKELNHTYPVKWQVRWRCFMATHSGWTQRLCPFWLKW